jgi:hypothetical protein
MFSCNCFIIAREHAVVVPDSDSVDCVPLRYWIATRNLWLSSSEDTMLGYVCLCRFTTLSCWSTWCLLGRSHLNVFANASCTCSWVGDLLPVSELSATSALFASMCVVRRNLFLNVAHWARLRFLSKDGFLEWSTLCFWTWVCLRRHEWCAMSNHFHWKWTGPSQQ